MVRMLSHLSAPGVTNMCIDEALLDCGQDACFRTYTWSTPTCSLGYFQDYHSVSASLPKQIDCVRRITGGGAIWHEHEVTYCVVFPASMKPVEKSEELYESLHGLIRTACEKRGATLARQEKSSGDRRYREEPRCFASPAAGDLLVRGVEAKTLGSAMRQRGERILMHGSLKTDTNSWDLDRSAGCGLNNDECQAALTEALRQWFDNDVNAGELTQREKHRQKELEKLRYGDEDWVQHRKGPKA